MNVYHFTCLEFTYRNTEKSIYVYLKGLMVGLGLVWHYINTDRNRENGLILSLKQNKYKRTGRG